MDGKPHTHTLKHKQAGEGQSWTRGGQQADFIHGAHSGSLLISQSTPNQRGRSWPCMPWASSGGGSGGLPNGELARSMQCQCRCRVVCVCVCVGSAGFVCASAVVVRACVGLSFLDLGLATTRKRRSLARRCHRKRTIGRPSPHGLKWHGPCGSCVPLRRLRNGRPPRMPARGLT